MARDASCITLRPAIIDLDITALDPAEFTEGLLKRLYACLPFGVVGNRHKYPEPSHPFGLRARRERPRRRDAERSRCDQVDNQIELAGLLDRQVLLTLQNTPDIETEAAPLVGNVTTIG